MSMAISERRGAVVVLMLNNPAQCNALAWGMLRDLDAALDAALGDAQARAILLIGALREGVAAFVEKRAPKFAGR